MFLTCSSVVADGTSTAAAHLLDAAG
jgi:hypothetical protein